MWTTGSKTQLFVGCFLILVIAGAIAGIFVTFAPEGPRYTYWMAMADLIVMGMVASGYFMSNLRISSGQQKSTFSVAMHTAIGTTLSLFFLASLAIDVVFLTSWNKSGLDRVFVWVVIGKWIVLAAVCLSMWIAGSEGREREPAVKKSRQRRVSIAATMDQALSDIRHLAVTDEERPSLHQVTDDMDALRNRVRSWISAPPLHSDNSEQIDGLVCALADAVKELGSIPQSQRVRRIAAVRGMAREISAQLDRSRASG